MDDDDFGRLNQTRPQGKKIYLAVGGTVFVTAMLLRATYGDGSIPPFDDLYHLKRIAAFPSIPAFDPDRNAFTPWPPLYDFVMGFLGWLGADVRWVPPVAFSLLAALVSLSVVRCSLSVAAGLIAGLGLAVSPYLIGVSAVGRIDHHWVEPFCVLAILATLRRPWLLGIAIAVALFVQPALLVAAGIAFVLAERDAWRGFALAAVLVAIYRLTRPEGYPESAWFFGWPHIAMLAAAAVALFATKWMRKPLAILLGGATTLLFPGALTAFVRGATFFGGDPWLESIVEFQPMFRDPAAIGTDLANLTGGAFLAFAMWKRDRRVALFAIVYLLLALTSRRFLVPGIAVFVLAGATYWRPRVAALLTLLPPIAFNLVTWRDPLPDYSRFRKVAEQVRALPPGRVLAPWSYGHAINVIGKHPVVIDNFGSMPDPQRFEEANAALRASPEERMRWCREHGVRWVIDVR